MFPCLHGNLLSYGLSSETRLTLSVSVLQSPSVAEPNILRSMVSESPSLTKRRPCVGGGLSGMESLRGRFLQELRCKQPHLHTPDIAVFRMTPDSMVIRGSHVGVGLSGLPFDWQRRRFLM